MPQHHTRHTFRQQATIVISTTIIELELRTAAHLAQGFYATINAILSEILDTIATIEIE